MFYKFLLPLNFIGYNLLGSLVIALLVGQFLSGLLVTNWKGNDWRVVARLGAYLGLNLKGYLTLHTFLASFWYVYLIAHIYRSIIYVNHFFVYWITGILMFYFTFLLIGTGYLLPCNFMSETAYLLITSMLFGIPYLGPLLTVLFIKWTNTGFKLEFDFRYFFILHSAIAMSFIVLSMYHFYIIHVFGSRTVEQANVAADLGFCPETFLCEWGVWIWNATSMFFFARLDHVIAKRDRYWHVDIDFLKKSGSHWPIWHLATTYFLVALLSTADPRWMTYILWYCVQQVIKWILFCTTPRVGLYAVAWFAAIFTILNLLTPGSLKRVPREVIMCVIQGTIICYFIYKGFF